MKYDLGRLRKGSTAVVTLGSQANVLLMSASNYNAYRSGRRCRYYGGLAKRSPVRLTVPSDGHWYVAVDLGGRGGRIRSAVKVEPPARGDLPTLQEADASLSRLRNDNPVEPPIDVMGGRTWDVFLSHAGEDKDAVAVPLAEALSALGVDVWLDQQELQVGDSLRRRIDQGLSSSRFGVVVCSGAFFSKGWPQYELDGLVTLSVAGRQRILPIWHGLSHSEVMAASPSLADKVALDTAVLDVGAIAEKIAAVVLGAEADG